MLTHPCCMCARITEGPTILCACACVCGRIIAEPNLIYNPQQKTPLLQNLDTENVYVLRKSRSKNAPLYIIPVVSLEGLVD